MSEERLPPETSDFVRKNIGTLAPHVTYPVTASRHPTEIGTSSVSSPTEEPSQLGFVIHTRDQRVTPGQAGDSNHQARNSSVRCCTVAAVRLVDVASDVGRHALLGKGRKVVPQRASSREQFPISFHERTCRWNGWDSFHDPLWPRLPHLNPRVMPVTLVGTGRVKFSSLLLSLARI